MDWARRIVPPAWLLLALLAQWSLHHFLPIAQLLRPPASWCGIVFLGAGIGLAFSGVSAFRRARTPIIPFERSTALVTDGVYRYTRNPMYLGLALIVAGTALLLGSIGALVPLPLFVWILEAGYIRAEERFLAAIFGGEYLQYTDRVRRWL
jgi:protein-S-isoprenylcysteine O-methyltransferase Ste14